MNNNEVHYCNTRKTSQLHKTYNRTNYIKHSLSNNGLTILYGLENNYKSWTLQLSDPAVPFDLKPTKYR